MLNKKEFKEYAVSEQMVADNCPKAAKRNNSTLSSIEIAYKHVYDAVLIHISFRSKAPNNCPAPRLC